MLFTLPSDVRSIIWRRARFLLARDTLALTLVAHGNPPRHRFTVDQRSRELGPFETVEVCLDMPCGKYMIMNKRRFHHCFPDSPERYSDSYSVLHDKLTCWLLERNSVVRLFYRCQHVQSSWYTCQNAWVQCL